jgi:predicted  nucleic acid-binding Zn-ribbon protein
MIRIFRANDTDYSTNGEVILKPQEAFVTKNLEEEYIEIIAPLKYAEFLIQDNIIIVDTLTGEKGYRIHNPITGTTISVKAWLFYQKNVPSPADRGVVIAHKKNMDDCEVTENWDTVVTKLIPVGYNDMKLPEGYLSVPNPYQKTYEKTIEFDLTESLENQVEAMEEEIEGDEAIVGGLESSIIALQSKLDAYTISISSMQAEKTALQQRLSQLGTSEAELKEKAVIEAQLPLITGEISNMQTEKSNANAALNTSKTDLIAAKAKLSNSQSAYNAVVVGDLRSQAQAYLDINKYPQINYNLAAHLEGIIEVGDIVHIKHPDIRVDLLAAVTALKWNCLTRKFVQIEIGKKVANLKGTITEIKEAVADNSETIKKTANTVNKYRSEYKRDNEELLSKFTQEIYGSSSGIYGLLTKYQSVFRQTASELSGTVSRVNADLSTQVATLKITADAIASSVISNYTTLDGKINENASRITQTATEIRSEVSASVVSLDGRISNNTSLISQTATQIRSEVNSKLTNYSTTTQMNSAINQSASSITSSVTTSINGVKTDLSKVEQTANKITWLVKSGSSSSDFTLTDRAINLVAEKINIDGYVEFRDLYNSGSTSIHGANIITGTLAADKITTGYLSASRISGGSLDFNFINALNLSASLITTGILDASRITVKNLNASSITSGFIEVSYIRANGYRAMNVSGNTLSIGGTSSYYAITNVNLEAQSLGIGASGGSIGFFGGSRSYKVSVSNVSSMAELAAVRSTLIQLITALKGYNLI